ncbi:MAG: DUF2155 domain-containing protein [Alphaproteobacteria bacterium]|nr:DUF2155 domain-containing protein [Alphaproteobacteria bacterium]
MKDVFKTPIRITFATAAIALAAAGASALEPRGGVKIRALDKITGNASDLSARIGDTIKFGRLSLTVRACFQAAPEDTPESVAFLEISTTAPAGAQPASLDGQDRGRGEGPLFSGWMFASSPGLSALEHPVYDVWVISCSTSAPDGR